ncbi:MAG: hypothetical protein QOI21_2422 [Actinomycetota bacterium]|nr:hypothetical protein [Actinomycetota bacterium]
MAREVGANGNRCRKLSRNRCGPHGAASRVHHRAADVAIPAWRNSDEYSINEATFIFVRGGLGLPMGEFIGDLIVSRPEFRSYTKIHLSCGRSRDVWRLECVPEPDDAPVHGGPRRRGRFSGIPSISPSQGSPWPKGTRASRRRTNRSPVTLTAHRVITTTCTGLKRNHTAALTFYRRFCYLSSFVESSAESLCPGAVLCTVGAFGRRCLCAT